MTHKAFIYTDHQARERDFRAYNERCVSCGRPNVVQYYGESCGRCESEDPREARFIEDHQERKNNQEKGEGTMSTWSVNEDEHAYIRAEEARERSEGLEYEEWRERMSAQDERYEDEPEEDEDE